MPGVQTRCLDTLAEWQDSTVFHLPRLSAPGATLPQLSISARDSESGPDLGHLHESGLPPAAQGMPAVSGRDLSAAHETTGVLGLQPIRSHPVLYVHRSQKNLTYWLETAPTESGT